MKPETRNKKINDAVAPILKRMFKRNVSLSHMNVNASAEGEIEIELVFSNTKFVFMPKHRLQRRNTHR